MRKISFIFCFLFLSVSLFAQTTVKKKPVKKTTTATVKTAPAESKTAATKATAPKTNPVVKSETKTESKASGEKTPAKPKEDSSLLIKKGSRLVVLVQSIENLEKGEENWLPGAVRDRLEDNLGTYTEYIYVDAKNLSSVKKLQKESETNSFDENDAIEIGKLTVAKYAVFITLRKTDAGYAVVADVTNLTSGEKIATALSSTYKTTDGLFSIPGCAADDLTVKLCQKLGIKLTKERKYMLMYGDNILSAEEELKITKTEEKLYKSSIDRLEKEIDRLSKSTDLKATSNKAKLEADKAMAEEKLKAAQDKKKRLAEEAKKAREDAEEDEARSEEQKQKRDQMAKEAAEKAAEVRHKILDSESIFTKITVIENKKKALLDIQQSVDNRRAEIFEEEKADFPKKIKAIRNKKYRAAEKDEDGNPSEIAIARREKMVKNLQLKTKENVDIKWNDVRTLTLDSISELYEEIKNDQESLETVRKVTSLEDDLKIQIKAFNGKTNAWKITFWLYSNGLPVTNQSMDLKYEELTGKEIDISNDASYDDFMDTVDLYNSLFSRGDPVLTFSVLYTVNSESDHTSSYMITLDDVEVTDTITGIKLCKLSFPETKIKYQMNPVYDLTGDMILRIPSKPEWDKKEADYKNKIYGIDEASVIEMVKIPGSDFVMAKTEITQKLYREMMGTNPSYRKGDNKPVETVSWVNALQFCNKLSQKHNLQPVYKINGSDSTWDKTANGYRLPTASEFEYASKGGQSFKYAGSDIADEVAWYYKNSENSTHEVGQKKPNGYGLYDMSGNVSEWCWDKNYNSRSVKSGNFKSEESIKINYLNQEYYSYTYDSIGFRVCRNDVSPFYEKEPLPPTINTNFFWSKYESFLSVNDIKMKQIPGKNYYMSETEVPQELYKVIMDDNPSKVEGDRLPVENVRPADIAEFCNKLSELNGYEKAYTIINDKITWNYEANGYRLPTKGEWEYAAFGNEKYLYAGSDTLEDVAWCSENSDSIHEVKTKKANKFGLYDMSGNVSEFVWTGSEQISVVCGGSFCLDQNLYSDSEVLVPSGDTGFRLCRGAVHQNSIQERNLSFAKEVQFYSRENAILRIEYPILQNSYLNSYLYNKIVAPAKETFNGWHNDEWKDKGEWFKTVEQVTKSGYYYCFLVSTIDPERNGPGIKTYQTYIWNNYYNDYSSRSSAIGISDNDLYKLCEKPYQQFEKEIKKKNKKADAGGYTVLAYYLLENNILTQWIELGASLPDASRKICKVQIDISSKSIISFDY